MKRSPKIKFKESGRYWYLYWIGQIVYIDKVFKIKLYFVNTIQPNNLYNGFTSKKEMITVPVEVLSFLTLGTLYDTEENEYIFPADYYNESWSLNVNIPSGYNPTKKELPFIDSKYSVLTSNMDFNNLRYYIFASSKKERIFLTMETICNYAFFRTSKLVGMLLNNNIHDLFVLGDRKIITANDRRVGLLKYDNHKLSYADAREIAHFFFMKNNKGITSLEAIESRLKNFFIANRNNKDQLEAGTYLDTDLPFNANIKFKLQGRKFSDGDSWYFLASRIVSHENDEELFLIDEVRLEELHPKNSTKERDSLDKVKVTLPKPPKNNSSGVTLDNTSGNSRANIQEENFNVNNASGFGIPVTKIVRDTQDKAYDVNLIPSDDELNGATICTYDVDPNSQNARLNFTEHFAPLESISRFDFIRLAIKKLEEEYRVVCKYDNLDNTYISPENIYYFQNRRVMVISLNFNDKFYYLVELDRGYTGFIYDDNKNQISPFTLDLFLKECIKKLSTLKKKQHIWTIMRKIQEEILHDLNIVIDDPLAHQTEGFKSTEEATSHMAKKIFNDKILKVA